MQSRYSIELNVERSDTNCGVYLRAAFMTIFALDPEAIIQGLLL